MIGQIYPYRLPPYNGFSHEERVATNAIQRLAASKGEFQFPVSCSICGFSDVPRYRSSGYIYAHLEDYRKPLECYGCCRPCHASLHARFREPTRWENLARRHWRAGGWFTLLSLDPASQTQSFDLTYPTGLP